MALPIFISAFRSNGRSAQRYLSVLAILVGALLLVVALRAMQIEHAARQMEDRREAAVRSALDHVQRDFRRRQQELRTLARALASEPRIVNALRLSGRGQADAAEDAAAYLQELAPSEWVEIYDGVPRLFAWYGTSMPTDGLPQDDQTVGASRIEVVRDRDWRTGLAAWWPIGNGRTLGMVRVIEPVEIRRRLTNRYLRDYGLAREWTLETGLLTAVNFSVTDVPPAEMPLARQAIYGIEGIVLGWVTVEPPTDEAILSEVGKRHGDAASFLATLLIIWLLAGLWVLYERAPEEKRGWFAAGGVAIGLWLSRFALLAMNVPGRWQEGKAPLAPLFDPTRFASTAGFGLLRSIGDFVLTALVAALFALVCVHLIVRLARRARAFHDAQSRRSSSLLRTTIWTAAGSTIVLLLLAGLSSIVHRAVLDSTLDYFTRSGIIPGPSEWLVAVVFCGLLLYTFAVVLMVAVLLCGSLLSVSVLYRLRGASYGTVGTLLAAALVPAGILYLALDVAQRLPWPAALAILLASAGGAYLLIVRPGEGVRLLTLRGVLLSVFVTAVLLYPIYYSAMDMKRRVQMVDASQSFNEGRDPRVVYGIEQVLSQVRRSGEIIRVMQSDTRAAQRRDLDSLATQVLRSSLIGSLGPYDVSLSLLTEEGTVAGRDIGAEAVQGSQTIDRSDSVEFDILRDMYAEAGTAGPLVEQMTGRVERDRFQYAGIAPILLEEDSVIVGWAMARVEPQTLLRYGETSFPRVLLPDGVVENVHANLSIAEFQNGVLVRSLGRPFGRYRLSDEVLERLATDSELWARELVEERKYLTYYRRQDAPVLLDVEGLPPRASPSIVAVRGAAVNTFDHLFYLLRLTVTGLFLGLPLYLASLYIRWRAGLLPAVRVPFREKVLNAFLGVGIISVVAVGIVGRQVVRESTEASVRSSLRQHLERVEQTLALEARGDELPYRVVERMGVDSLAARAGLDLNVYRGHRLTESSRPQLIEDRLLDTRMPMDVYTALYFEGHRFVTSTEHIGTFAYKAGFRTLLDERGLPRLVVSVPILPEQERIEEEQARTVAYLFGALLILILLVMLTASILANALTRPIARIRVGLEAVARGRFERNIPVRSRDEIGELAETFNSMQEQLSDSRRRLAQQERQLAWREMARQVAHEIRNPLTPMKLSVQHLRRAFDDVDGGLRGAGTTDRKFARMFERVTATLIEQINALARIADEFSSFAKLPTRVQEEMDLNAVIEQAADLMHAEVAGELIVNLREEPLIVRADREELRRVYINLIKNAFQAIPENREGVVIVETERVTDDAGRAWGSSRIIDNGTGVSAENREKIFEPNFSTKTSGMGLGLAIVRRSIEEMRGEIGFESIEGEGSTFWIRLPLIEQT